MSDFRCVNAQTLEKQCNQFAGTAPSRQTPTNLCECLSQRGAKGEGRKGDLPRFGEEAVRSYWLEKAVEQANGAAAGMGETELNDLIDEAVQWAREH